MPDLEISNLPPLSGAALQSTDPIPLTDLSASETKKITAKDLIQNGIALIDPGSIPADKVVLSLPAGSVGTAELANGAVTAIKMADGSSGIVQAGPLPTGNFQGQIGVDLADDLFYVWDGGAWHPVAGAASVNEITASTSGLVLITLLQTGDTVNLQAGFANTAAASEFLAGPDSGPGAVTQRKITSADLPLATATDTGAVVPGGGLTVNGTGVLSVDNTVTPETNRSVATWNAQGLVTGGGPIQPNDLPIAAAGTVGVVYPGPNLSVNPAGELTVNNAVTAGTHPKITFNSVGLITAGMPLDAVDIPVLDASKITTGTFDPSLFGTGQITREMLADYSIAYIQEATPALTGNHIGVLWFQESTAQLSMWNGNSWFPIGQARLTAENLRYCGTIDATTGLVTGVTAFGTAAGYSIGDALKTATDQQTGVYFVVDTPGANISKVAGVTFDAGDWVLCNGAVTGTGYVRIDTLSGGGGGGASKIGDLLDVTLTTPVTGDVLQYNAGGQWVNVNEFDEGTYP